jgi:hypothetical protein
MLIRTAVQWGWPVFAGNGMPAGTLLLAAVARKGPLPAHPVTVS